MRWSTNIWKIGCAMRMACKSKLRKGGLASYAFENFRIAIYKANITVIAMTDWLSQNFDGVVREVLQRDNENLRAKTLRFKTYTISKAHPSVYHRFFVAVGLKIT